jgi:hypothetical protein
VWTLGLSFVIALLILVALLVTIGGNFALWRRPEAPAGAAVLGALRETIPAFFGVAVFLLAWWATSRAFAWHAAYAGQIDAWIIAQSGRSETTVLHQAIDWAIWILRWGIGLTVALSLAADMTSNGFSAVGQMRWIRRALHPRSWIVVALLVGLLLHLPWHFVNWRPQRMALRLEPYFVGAKLATIAILSALGSVLAARVVTPEDRSGTT